MDYQFVTHESLKPFINKDSEILILGSFPSPMSRKENFYYAHKTNRFFKILSSIYNEEELKTVEEKKDFLRRHKIALYDVIESCYIKGASDSSIKDVVPSDIEILIKGTNIKKIYTTGSLADKLYKKYISDNNIPLPSPSARNAAMDLNKLIDAYSIILN